MQKTRRTTQNLSEQIKAKRSENSSFSYAKLQHPKFGVTFRQRSHAKSTSCDLRLRTWRW